jgi:hypothetical protein
MADDELRVLGKIEVRAGGAPLELPPQQAKALAVLLAARPGQSVPRSELVDALWPAAPDTDRLPVVLSKLRHLLRTVGLTISSGHGRAGYLLCRLDGPSGVEPADILDATAVAAGVERGERLLEAGRSAEAVAAFRAAAQLWRGEPFTVGDDDWLLPRICRAAAERLDPLLRRLAKGWARSGLLFGDYAVLDWLDQDATRRAAVEHDREVWLARFVAALAEGDSQLAEAMLEQRRPQWGYDDPMTVRCGQLLELRERGAELGTPQRPVAQPSEHRAALAAFVDSVPTGAADLLRLVGPTGPARAGVLDELVALADAAGVRVIRAVCDGADDLSPGRNLMRDLWAAALTDTQFPPESYQRMLVEAVASPRPSVRSNRKQIGRLVDAAVALLAALARRRPVLVVIDDAHLLTPLAVDMTEEIRGRLAGVAAAYAVPGADTGPYAERGIGTAVLVATDATAPRPDRDGWLAAAVVTADRGEIDPLLVAAVLGVPTARADAGLAAAVRSGAVLQGDPVRFANGQVREAVLGELAAEPGRLRRLHAAAYHHLAGRSGARAADPARVARHALAARPDVPDEAVAAACLAAAVGERKALRAESAIDFAIRGLALTDDPDLRFDLQIAHGDARHDRADMYAANTAFFAAYHEAGTPQQRAFAAVRLSRRWMNPGQLDSVLLQLFTTSRDALEGCTDRESRELWMLLNATTAHWSTMGVLPVGPIVEVPEGVRLARIALAALTPETTPEVACEVLTECRYALFDHISAAQSRAMSARLEEVAAGTTSVHFTWEGLIQATVDHMRLGDMVAASSACERHRELVAHTGHGMGPWSVLALDTIFDLWHGDLAAAEARILGPMRAMLDARPRDVSDSMQQTWMGQLFWLRHQQGRMAELADAGVVRLVERRQYFVVWLPAMALLLAQLGQPDAAVDQLVAMLDLTADLRALPPHGMAVPTLAVAAEAIDGLRGYRTERLDIPDLARRIDELIEPHTGEMALAGWPSVLIGPVRRARGQLALAAGDPAAALEHFDRAVHEVGAAPAQLAWLRLHRARAMLALPSGGRDEQARELLESALETATSRGMGALVNAINREMPVLGASASAR